MNYVNNKEFKKMQRREFLRGLFKFTLNCLIVAAALVLIVAGINSVYKKQCYSQYKEFEPEYVGVLTGCMITVDEQRIPSYSFRMTL